MLVNTMKIEISSFLCSPLFFALQVLVNASFVDGGMDLDNDAISCIFSIFRAIKRADDAVDAQRTLVSIVSCRMVSFLKLFFVLY